MEVQSTQVLLYQANCSANTLLIGSFVCLCFFLVMKVLFLCVLKSEIDHFLAIV